MFKRGRCSPRRRLFIGAREVASAHCDTEGGPAVTDGRKALQTGNVNYALKWILPEGESELRRPIFD